MESMTNGRITNNQMESSPVRPTTANQEAVL